MKKILIIIIIFIAGIIIGSVFLAKEKEVIKYKEKIVYKEADFQVSEAEQIIKYKDRVVYIKPKKIKQKETIKVETIEKEIIKPVHYNTEISPIVSLTMGAKVDTVGFIVYKQFIGRIYLGAGFNYKVDYPDIYYVGDTITKDSPSFLDKTTILVGIKIPFNI